MLKKKLIKVFIFFLLFTFNSNVKINSQLISYSDTYASLELYKSIYNIENELLKDAEDKLLSIITKHKNISVNDLSKFAIANIDLQNGNYIMALKYVRHSQYQQSHFVYPSDFDNKMAIHLA